MNGGFNISSMPKSLTCYICGRGYGTKSLGIHLKTCMKKFQYEESLKPRKMRRPVPQPPAGLMEVIPLLTSSFLRKTSQERTSKSTTQELSTNTIMKL